MRIAALGWVVVLLSAGGPSPAAVPPVEVELVAGQNQYSAPSWFPLRGAWVIGCTWGNGCSGGYHGYAALDIARDPKGSVSGDPVHAAGAGLATVVSTGSTCGSAGNTVVVDHGSGVRSYYGHLSRIAIPGPTWVDQDSVLGYVGATGNVQPCTYHHLHFEVRVNGARANPGALKACVGGRLTSYPAELGRADWSQVPLWSGVTNDGTGCASPLPPSPPAAPPIPATGELSRYAGDDHVSLTWGPRPNDRFELSLGTVSKVPVPGSHAIYLCRVGSGDNFTSVDAACEGQLVVGLLGYVFDSPEAAGVPTVPVRRCVVRGSGEHFDSNDLGCEGHHAEHVLGYAIARTSLSRYTGDDHVSLTWGARGNDRLEQDLGLVSKVPVSGSHAIYLCRVGSGDNFSSVDAACEGQLVVGLLGYVFDSPEAAGVPTVPVRRCVVRGSGEHFDSNDLGCEGHHSETLLGYALAS
ncbi:M23 family metallopeptidase [Saccharothrix stipae]